jgi:hypothetical protein
MTISRWILLRMRNGLDKHCREYRNTSYVQQYISEKCYLWDDVEKCGRASEICNPYCFSTVTMVSRTLFNVTLYVQCLSCLYLSLTLWEGGGGGSWNVYEVCWAHTWRRSVLHKIKILEEFTSSSQCSTINGFLYSFHSRRQSATGYIPANCYMPFSFWFIPRDESKKQNIPRDEKETEIMHFPSFIMTAKTYYVCSK